MKYQSHLEEEIPQVSFLTLLLICGLLKKYNECIYVLVVFIMQGLWKAVHVQFLLNDGFPADCKTIVLRSKLKCECYILLVEDHTSLSCNSKRNDKFRTGGVT